VNSRTSLRCACTDTCSLVCGASLSSEGCCWLWSYRMDCSGEPCGRMTEETIVEQQYAQHYNIHMILQYIQYYNTYNITIHMILQYTYNITIHTILQYVQYYNTYNITIYIQYYNTCNITIHTILQYIQCYNTYNITIHQFEILLNKVKKKKLKYFIKRMLKYTPHETKQKKHLMRQGK